MLIGKIFVYGSARLFQFTKFPDNKTATKLIYAAISLLNFGGNLGLLVFIKIMY